MVTGSRQFVEQRLCFFEIGGIEAFGEPVVNRREKIAGLVVTTLVSTEPGEATAARNSQSFTLLLGNAQSFAIEFLGRLGAPLPQQQLALVAF